MNKIEKLQEIIDASDNIVFFGGAGVSTESGIPDFRSESGIFKSLEKYGDTPERLVSHSYYLEHTEEFFSYYKDCLIFPEAEPNSAHYTLARLEKEGKLKEPSLRKILMVYTRKREAKTYWSFTEVFIEITVKYVKKNIIWTLF